MTLLIQFLLAHLIADFFLQPDRWVKDKEEKKWRSPFLYLHTAVNFILILVITGNAGYWKQALWIAGLHFIIDLCKVQFQKTRTKRIWFFIDQGLHVLTITAVWAFSTHWIPDWHRLQNKNALIILTAVLTLINPASVIVKTIISKWPPDLTASRIDQQTLQDAGKWIGILERLMIFGFILLGKWEGIGFLLAAKSVFRFGDLKDARDMKLTEYVLIGTLLSFGVAMLLGALTVHFTGIDANALLN